MWKWSLFLLTPFIACATVWVFWGFWWALAALLVASVVVAGVLILFAEYMDS